MQNDLETLAQCAPVPLHEYINIPVTRSRDGAFTELIVRQIDNGATTGSLWGAGFALINYLQSEAGQLMDESMCVVELGTGTGAVGLVAEAVLGARVLLTDQYVSLATENYHLNTNLVKQLYKRIDVAELLWGNIDQIYHAKNWCGSNGPNLILAADVVYPAYDLDSLFLTISSMLSSGPDCAFPTEHGKSIVLLSYISRSQETTVALSEAIERYGFSETKISMSSSSLGIITPNNERSEAFTRDENEQDSHSPTACWIYLLERLNFCSDEL
jgi:predicted nicotinamide N-methyase